MTEDAALARRAARGVISTGLAQVLRFLVQTASVVVLSRLLLPSDFGAFAVAWGVVGLVDLLRDLGLQSAAVRAPSLTRQQSSNLFWLGILMGAALAGGVAVASPVLGAMVGSDDVATAVLALAPVFLVSGAVSQYRALLMRALRFSVMNTIDVVSAVVGLIVAVVAALSGWGYWALILQVVATSVTVLVAVVVATRWRPTTFRRGHGTADFVRFGGAVLLSQVFAYSANTLDSTLVGLSSGQAAAGEYNRGAQVIRTPLRQIQAPLGLVAVPVLVKLPRGDHRVDRLLESGQVALSLPVFAATAVCVAVPEEAVLVALGPGWRGAVPIMVIIALAMCVQTIGATGAWALVAHGDAKTVGKLTAMTGATTLSAMAVGSAWGPVGVAAGSVVASLLNVPVNMVVLRRLGVLRPRPLLMIALRGATVCTAAGAFAHEVTTRVAPASAFTTVALAGVVVVAVIAVGARLWPGLRRDIWAVLDGARAARRA